MGTGASSLACSRTVFSAITVVASSHLYEAGPAVQCFRSRLSRQYLPCHRYLRCVLFLLYHGSRPFRLSAGDRTGAALLGRNCDAGAGCRHVWLLTLPPLEAKVGHNLAPICPGPPTHSFATCA